MTVATAVTNLSGNDGLPCGDRPGGARSAARPLGPPPCVESPLLVETFVDANGSRYRETSGRGRGDRQHRLHGAQPKRVLVYRLRRDARQRLPGDGGRS